jgi:hypothetical protein
MSWPVPRPTLSVIDEIEEDRSGVFGVGLDHERVVGGDARVGSLAPE